VKQTVNIIGYGIITVSVTTALQCCYSVSPLLHTNHYSCNRAAQLMNSINGVQQQRTSGH